MTLNNRFLKSGIALGVLFLMPGTIFATVVNTKHDMYFMGKGTDRNTCSYCHVPHNAIGDKIWSGWNKTAMPTGYSAVGNMCYTCHDGTVTSIGAATVFNLALQQHKVSSGKDCNMCHSVHDNTNGKFLNIVKTRGSNSESETYCETCHDATMYSGAEALGDHTAGTEHPYKDNGNVLDQSCNSCHTAHGAVDFATGSSTLKKPILRQDNTRSAYCAACHPANVQATTGGNKHPANPINGNPSYGTDTCMGCHDVHQPSKAGYPFLLRHKNIDSAYCIVCHNGITAPDIGEHTHPTGVAFTTKGLTPSAKDIDDNSDGNPDYPANTEVIACESCHSIHRKGAAYPLLRVTKENAEICLNCHTDK